ncbi:MAG: N-acetylglucosamine/diacetylchitobiose ABC transporter substrate-binding protein [Propionibacteriaceae bacterium]|jgi:N-acetylglucosamine transport system substrate-binding protein|nr:N-acetylglucosamine/diacetylchitobiose ABC transporter substrate-binding protein [Propionibacteriaceae bacterium]
MPKTTLTRAGILIATAAALTLSACASGSGSDTPTTAAGSSAPAAATSSEAPAASADNPFGVEAGSTATAMFFNGGYGTDWADYAAALAAEHSGTHFTTTVTPSTEIQQELQPLFVAGTPPDLVNTNGGVAQLVPELLPLDDVWASESYDGGPLLDSLVSGVKEAGTYNGLSVRAPYVVTAYGLWYSASLFEANGWTPPATWDDVTTLCDQVKAAGKYCFAWGKEAAAYWDWFAADVAIKEGGRDVYLNIANLKDGAWSDPAVVATLTEIKKTVDAGYWMPGGAGTAFGQAQIRWSNDQDVAMYYTGTWIEGEMKDSTAEGFEMSVAPVPSLSANGAYGAGSVATALQENLIIPAAAKNPAAAKEILRALYSKDAASHFSQTRMTLTVVKDTVPEDGYGSTALATAAKLVNSSETMPALTNFLEYYGLYADHNVLWNSFLSGELSVDEMVAQLQEISDKLAADSSIDKITFS